MRIPASLVAVLVSLLVGLALAEAMLRLLGIGYGNAPFEGDPVLHHVHPRSFTFLSYDPNGEFGGHSVHYDERGLRAPAAGYGPARPLTVAVLGDSVVEALQVAHEETFVGLLNAAQTQATFLNYGVSRYSPVVSELQLRALLPQARPAVVLHVTHRNDPGEDREYFRDARLDGHQVPQAVPGDQNALVGALRSLYVARLVRRAQIQFQWMVSGRGVAAGAIVEDNDPPGDVTRAAFERARKLAQANNAVYVLACVPSQIRMNGVSADHADRYCPAVAEYAKSVDVPYIDLEKAFGRPAEPPFFSIDIHFNRLGHRLAAQAILDGLQGQGLLAKRDAGR